MKQYFENLARALIGVPYGKQQQTQQEVIRSIAEGEAIAENYKVSLKTDLEIIRLHEKIDRLLADKEKMAAPQGAHSTTAQEGHDT